MVLKEYFVDCGHEAHSIGYRDNERSPNVVRRFVKLLLYPGKKQ